MGTRSEQHPTSLGWGRLEEVVDRLALRARSEADEQRFYAQLVDAVREVLSPAGAVVWLARADALRPVCVAGEIDDSSGALQRHARRCLATGEPVTVAAEDNDPALVLAPVADAVGGAGPRAVVCVALEEGASGATLQAAGELLETVCGCATDFHACEELRAARGSVSPRVDLLRLMARLQSRVGLQAVAYETVNEARRLLGFDRVSLVVRRRGKSRLLAASGADRVEQRGEAARNLTDLAGRIAAWGEPLEHRDAGELIEHAPPEIERALGEHLDQSHARALTAVPFGLRSPGDDKPAATAVLVGECFGGEATRSRLESLTELSTCCEPALAAACALDSPLVRAAVSTHNAVRSVADRLGVGRAALIAAAAVAVAAALLLVRVPFEVEAPATLRPAAERHVFAGEDGVVEEVLVHHGQEVQAGQVLVRLRDPQLAVELQSVVGEARTVRRRLEAIAAQRTDRRVRERPDDGNLPLGAEAQQLEKRLASLEAQQQILEHRLASLEVTSPIAGRVLDLDIEQQLRLRPVERGDVLLTVADLESGWRLEAELPQERTGHVCKAERASTEPLPVRYRLAGEPRKTYSGVLEEISESVPQEVPDPDDPAVPLRAIIRAGGPLPEAARPGMDATVRIDCGRRSVGFVWLHDAWETLYRWVTF